MDSISNMLIVMKNGSLAGKETVYFPYSKMKHAILECLKQEGYVASVAKKVFAKSASATGENTKHPMLEVGLIYTDKKPKISNVERISKQSRRVYLRLKDIHTVRNGSGLLVLSTPKGILAGSVARREQVGGEALFRVW